MHVVMTKAGKKGLHPGMDIIREIGAEIEELNESDAIKAKLNTLADGANFKLWADKIIPNPDVNRCRYENFVIGYVYRHDMLPGEEDHSVYFKWDGDRVRVFMSALSPAWEEPDSTEPAPLPSVIGVSAAASDPPGTTTPPPPLAGVSQ